MSGETAKPAPTSSVWALLVLVLLGLGVGLSFWLVGWLAAPEGHGFDWELASIFGTAVGTTLLALVTGWLAYSTRTEVRATQDLAELTRQEQAFRERPVILLWDQRFVPDPDNLGKGELRVKLRNVGSMHALGVHVEATYTGHDDWTPDITTETVPLIGPDATGVEPVLIVSGGQPPEGGIRDSFQVAGTCWDRSLRNEYPIVTDWLRGRRSPEDAAHHTFP